MSREHAAHHQAPEASYVEPTRGEATPEQIQDGSRLIRGSLLRLLSFAAMVMLSVASTAAVTRDLGVSRFGQYTTVISVTTLVTIITDSGMINVAIRDYALLDGKRREERLSTLLGLRMSLTCVGSALSVGFAFAAHYDGALILGMVLASAATFPLIVLHTVSIPLSNDLRLGTLSMLELLRQLLWAGGLIALSVVHATVLPLLATLLAAHLILVPVTIRVTGISRVLVRMRLTGWRELIGPSLLFSLATAVGTAYLYGTQLVTSLTTSHVQTGLFAVVFRVFSVTTSIPILVGSAATPVLARAGRDDPDRLAYVLKRYLEVSILAGLGTALALSAAAGLIIPVIAGGQFKAAIAVATIQPFALVGTFVAAPCVYGLLTLNLYRPLLVANISALTVMVIGTSLLAHAYGARGAAISSICCEMTVAVLMLAGLLRRLPGSRPPSAFVVKVLFASACAAPLTVGHWLPALPRTVAVGLLYVTLVLITRALPDEVAQTLPLLRRPA